MLHSGLNYLIDLLFLCARDEGGRLGVQLPVALADDASVGLLELRPDGLVGLRVVGVVVVDLWVFLVVDGDDLLVEVEAEVFEAAVQVPLHHVVLHQRRIDPLLLAALPLRPVGQLLVGTLPPSAAVQLPHPPLQDLVLLLRTAVLDVVVALGLVEGVFLVPLPLLSDEALVGGEGLCAVGGLFL